jgi:hypothetical protein
MNKNLYFSSKKRKKLTNYVKSPHTNLKYTHCHYCYFGCEGDHLLKIKLFPGLNFEAWRAKIKLKAVYYKRLRPRRQMEGGVNYCYLKLETDHKGGKKIFFRVVKSLLWQVLSGGMERSQLRDQPLFSVYRVCSFAPLQPGPVPHCRRRPLYFDIQNFKKASHTAQE